MDIPIYDPRDDYDYVPVRKPKAEAPEPKERDRHIDRDSPKQTERDDRSPIQRRLDSLKQRAADRRVTTTPHPKRERIVRHELTKEERSAPALRRSVQAGTGFPRLPLIYGSARRKHACSAT